jgi:hypothetical protein
MQRTSQSSGDVFKSPEAVPQVGGPDIDCADRLPAGRPATADAIPHSDGDAHAFPDAATDELLRGAGGLAPGCARQP